MKYLTDPEKHSQFHNLPEGETTLPVFPLGLHKARDGEPEYPHPSITLFSPGEQGDLRRAWIQWADSQPDVYLLAGERLLYEHWYGHPEHFPLQNLEGFTERWREIAEEVRTAGHVEILNRYWSHLSWFHPNTK